MAMTYWEHEEEPEKPHYKIAQICRNGHVRSVNVEYHDDGPRCVECGAENLTACQACGEPIHGRYHQPGVADFTGHHDFPKHCHNCGTPYPWTQSRIEAWRDLVQEMDVPPEERERLAGSLDDLIADTPRTELAILRVKKGLARAGADAVTAAKSILIEIATEAVKRGMGL